MATESGQLVQFTDAARRHSAVAGFIDSLKKRSRATSSPTALPAGIDTVARQVAQDEDLEKRFTATAQAVGMSVHPANMANWLDVVSSLLREHKLQSVVLPVPGDGFFDAQRLKALKQWLNEDRIDTRSEFDDATLFSVGAAITGVAAAICEHGTLVCRASGAVARGASLIPPVHIAVVQASQLVPDMCDYFDTLGECAIFPANITFITGPSKTADIEGVLVTGVHGPEAVHVVLVSPD